MKISRVEVRCIQLPLKEPTIMKSVRLDEINSVLVTVTLEDGVVGYGEVSMGPTLYADTMETTVILVEKYFGPALVGQRIDGLDRLDAVMDRAKPLGNVCARGALDLALHDALGKSLGVPVASLLGGAHADGWDMVGWIGLMPPAAAAERARTFVAEGFTWFKLKVSGDLVEDLARVAAVREVIGVGTRLRLDAGEAYSPQDALRLAQRVVEYDIELIEDPVPEDAWFAFADVRRRSPVPVCADGVIRSPRAAAQILASGCADMIKVKLQRAGGLVAARKIMTLAETFAVPVIVGRSTTGDIESTAELHLACSSRAAWGGGEFVGPSKATAHIVTEPLQLTGGRYALPVGPGFGITVDEDAVRRHQVTT
jgi:muconate cycloisomerase